MVQEEIELIRKAQAGDMTAFKRLVLKYDKEVLSIAKSFRNNSDDAQDIYQEVFIRVFRSLKNFQFKSELSTWIYRITHNVCISFYQSEKRRKAESIDREINPDTEETFADSMVNLNHPENKVDNWHLKELINKAIDELPAQQKYAFTLKFVSEYKIKEIAEMMNCNEGTIKRYLFNASMKMKNRLKYLLED